MTWIWKRNNDNPVGKIFKIQVLDKRYDWLIVRHIEDNIYQAKDLNGGDVWDFVFVDLKDMVYAYHHVNMKINFNSFLNSFKKEGLFRNAFTFRK